MGVLDIEAWWGEGAAIAVRLRCGATGVLCDEKGNGGKIVGVFPAESAGVSYNNVSYAPPLLGGGRQLRGEVRNVRCRASRVDICAAIVRS